MTTVSVQQQGAVVHHRAGQFCVELHGTELAVYPARTVTEFLLLGGTHMTTAALREAATLGISTHFLTLSGRHVATVSPTLTAQAELLRAQVHYSESVERTLQDARAIVSAKIHNSRVILKGSLPEATTSPVLHTLQALANTALHADSAASLLGIEGTAARLYFTAWRALLPDGWQDYFQQRAAHPPPDPVNALLSFGYSLLATRVLSSLQRAGLHAAFSAYHEPRGRRPALALDLMEEHRAYAVDTVVLRFMKLHPLTPELFLSAPRYLLEPPARRAFLSLFAERMTARLTARRRVQDVIHGQVLTFAEALRQGSPYLPLRLNEE